MHMFLKDAVRYLNDGNKGIWSCLKEISNCMEQIINISIQYNARISALENEVKALKQRVREMDNGKPAD